MARVYDLSSASSGKHVGTKTAHAAAHAIEERAKANATAEARRARFTVL
jgi:hypothetical protein